MYVYIHVNSEMCVYIGACTYACIQIICVYMHTCLQISFFACMYLNNDTSFRVRR